MLAKNALLTLAVGVASTVLTGCAMFQSGEEKFVGFVEAVADTYTDQGMPMLAQMSQEQILTLGAFVCAAVERYGWDEAFTVAPDFLEEQGMNSLEATSVFAGATMHLCPEASN